MSFWDEINSALNKKATDFIRYLFHTIIWILVLSCIGLSALGWDFEHSASNNELSKRCQSFVHCDVYQIVHSVTIQPLNDFGESCFVRSPF